MPSFFIFLFHDTAHAEPFAVVGKPDPVSALIDDLYVLRIQGDPHGAVYIRIVNLGTPEDIAFCGNGHRIGAVSACDIQDSCIRSDSIDRRVPQRAGSLRQIPDFCSVHQIDIRP